MIDKLEYIKIQNFHLSKHIIKRAQRLATEIHIQNI